MFLYFFAKPHENPHEKWDGMEWGNKQHAWFPLSCFKKNGPLKHSIIHFVYAPPSPRDGGKPEPIRGSPGGAATDGATPQGRQSGHPTTYITVQV